jgi:23S rRNA (guanosine2251-2'-O)-methyltransferase
LKIRKARQTGRLRSDREWIYGLNPVIEAIRAGRDIKGIFLSSSKKDSPKIREIEKEAEEKRIFITRTGISFFHAHFPKGHQGVAAEVMPKPYISLEELLEIPSRKNETSLFIVLDCIEDPRNLGAILRVADAVGVHGIVIQSHRSAALSSEVSKSSAGAVEYVSVSRVANIKHAIEEMKERDIKVVGAEAAGEMLAWDVNFKVPLALVIGSEGKGLRRTVRESCDTVVSLPMKGKINSLNVSVAVGMLAFEILRQRFHRNSFLREK